jgi:preprotein translocase subunit SecE
MAKHEDTEEDEFDETEESEGRAASDDVEESQGADAEQDDDSAGDPDAGAARAVDDTREVVEVDPDREAAALGATKYVHAAFFGAGILAAYLSGKLMLTAWNILADWPEAVRRVPQLIQYGEDERGTITLGVGAVLGVILVAYYYRRETVRAWAGEVASELSRVTWPNKETVTNGTMVVIVASLVATVYVALLDRFWGYLTNLVYGA